MNKETKVGLLVGLSFIVLFGVILSNHAPDIVSPPERPMLAPIQPHGTDVQVIRQIGTTTTPPPEPVDVIADATPQQPPAAPSASGEPPAVADAAAAAEGNASLVDATAPSPADATAPRAADAARTISADNLGPETAEAEPGDDGMELLSSKVAPDGTRTTVYIVKRGDCLAKIAREYYGDASNRNIDKIYEVNRERMPNKRTLAVGTKLELPVRPPSRDTGAENLLSSGKFDQVAELNPTHSEGSAKATDAPPASANDARKTAVRTTVAEVSQQVLDDILLKPSTVEQPTQTATGAGPLARPADPLDRVRDKAGNTKEPDKKIADREPDKTALVSGGKCKHYQIQKGDTWYGLAARFMGDGKRWHDLYALNDDILPDATKLRTGVKIRVPAVARGRLDSVVE